MKKSTIAALAALALSGGAQAQGVMPMLELSAGLHRIEAEVAGRPVVFTGEGNGPVEAAVAALGVPIRVQGFEERSMGEGADAAAVAIVEVAMDGVAGSCFGAGMHRNTVTASVRAIISAANRMRGRQAEAASQAEPADCVA